MAPVGVSSRVDNALMLRLCRQAGFLCRVELCKDLLACVGFVFFAALVRGADTPGSVCQRSCPLFMIACFRGGSAASGGEFVYPCFMVLFYFLPPVHARASKKCARL